MEKVGSNVVYQTYQIDANARANLFGHPAKLFWFTGLSGSGKSTLANAFEAKLFEHKIHTYCLDGDNIRMGLNAGLGFSSEDRQENLRRIAEVCKLFLDAGLVVIAAFVSPTKKDRQLVRDIVGASKMVEVFVDTPLEVCEARDVKGLYAKARAGEITNFTGISAPYEAPEQPDITLYTNHNTINHSLEPLWAYTKTHILNA